LDDYTASALPIATTSFSIGLAGEQRNYSTRIRRIERISRILSGNGVSGFTIRQPDAIRERSDSFFGNCNCLVGE
jgi:hypothetical protein